MGYVYILTNKPNGTLYIGVTSDLIRRIFEHKTKAVDGFSKRYGLDRLVYFETFTTIAEAIRREKRLKRYRRDWKIQLIEGSNPGWEDLYPRLVQ